MKKIGTIFTKKRVSKVLSYFYTKFNKDCDIKILKEYVNKNDLFEKTIIYFEKKLILTLLFMFFLFNIGKLFFISDDIIISIFLIFITINFVLKVNFNKGSSEKNDNCYINKYTIDELENALKYSNILNSTNRMSNTFETYIFPLIITILFKLTDTVSFENIVQQQDFIMVQFVSISIFTFLFILIKETWFCFINITNVYSEFYLNSFNSEIIKQISNKKQQQLT